MLLWPFGFGLVISAFVDYYKNYKLKYFGFLLVFAVTAFFVGFRGVEVGTDTSAYYEIFGKINSGDAGRYEPLYVYINLFFGFIFDEAFAVLFFLSSVSLFLILNLCLRYSPSFFLAFILFMSLAHYFYLFNIVRQGMAIAILCYSVKFILERQALFFIISVVIATGFHYSSVVFLGAYFLVFRLPVIFSLVWLISIFSYVDINPVALILEFFSGHLAQYYPMYKIDEPTGSSFSLRSAFYQAVALVLVYSISRKGFCEKGANLLMANLALVGISFGNFLHGYGWVSRLFDSYEIFIICALPSAIFYFFKGMTRISVTAFLGGALGLYYLRLISIGSHGVTPYVKYIGF